MVGISCLGVVVAVLSYYVLGLFWFSDYAFGPKWRFYTGLTLERIHASRRAIFVRNYLVSFICCCLVVSALVALKNHMPSENPLEWLRMVLVLNGAFIACTQVPAYLYQKRSLDLFLIDAGYHYVGIFLAAVSLRL